MAVMSYTALRVSVDSSREHEIQQHLIILNLGVGYKSTYVAALFASSALSSTSLLYPVLRLQNRTTMTPARIGVIGAGLAGPVLAVYLKLKGYDPVIYERNDSVSDAGLGIG